MSSRNPLESSTMTIASTTDEVNFGETSVLSELSDEFALHTTRSSSPQHTAPQPSPTRQTLQSPPSTPSYQKPSILNRRSVSTDSLTFDKLRFSKLGLYGRSEQMKVLSDCLERLATEGKKQIVFISGESGTGKSSLADSLKKNVQKRQGVFVRGKCSLNVGEQPYHVIAEAVAHLCAYLVSLESSEETNGTFEEIKNELDRSLGEDLLGVLAHVVPQIQEVVGVQSATDSAESLTFDEAKNRFNFIFRTFIRVVASHFSPFVLVLDDLQWIDQASLGLLKLLVSDTENSNLMLVGCYRSNEIHNEHLLQKLIVRFSELHGDPFDFQEISVDALSVSDVSSLLADLLSDDEPRMVGLAQICHRKTGGNVFFLLQFLSMLEATKLLEFSMNTFKWTWDEASIEARAGATDNIVDLVKEKMMKLPTHSIPVLEIAACLGHEFDERTLLLVLNELAESDTLNDILRGSSSCDGTNESDSEFSMNILVGERILERVGDDAEKRYCWIHDKIQEAALSLVDNHKLNLLKARIGNVLVSKLAEVDLEASIFVAVDLLNQGCRQPDSKDAARLAELNLRAAQKAEQYSAFRSALKYAESGIAALPQDHWESHFDLSLSLYLIAAQASSYHGDVDRMVQLCQEMIEQPACPFIGKLRTYNILTDSMSNRNQRPEALRLLLSVLRETGCTFPRNPVLISLSTIAGLMKAKGMIKRIPEKVSVLPLLTDPVRIEAFRLLDRSSTCCYLDGNPLVVATLLRSMQWTMRYGMCSFSPPAFAAVGLLFTGILCDLQTGKEYAKFALQLMERIKSKATEARTMMLVHHFILSYTNPLHTMLEPLSKAYSLGMASGDTESASWSVYGALQIAFQCGRPLVQIEEDSGVYIRQMQQLKREDQLWLTKVLRQVVLNLLGRSRDPTILTGERVDEDEVFERMSRPGFASNLSVCYNWKMVVLTFFGEYEECAKIALARGDRGLETSPGCPWLMTDVFIRGISLFTMARRTGKIRYARQARKCLAKIRKWSENGNPNVTHFQRLLEAELWAYKGKHYLAKNDYEAGTVLAARGGFIHDAALANERYAEFLLDEMDDKESAVYKLKEAIKLYSEWGAHAKAEQLSRKYDCFLSHPPTVLTLPLSGDLETYSSSHS